jgi:hypothetical protein
MATLSTDCTVCNTTLAECSEKMRSTGQWCCELCFVRDTHGLLGTGRLDRIEEMQHRFAQQMAAIVIWRTDTREIFGKIAQRLHVLEQADTVAEMNRLSSEVEHLGRQIGEIRSLLGEADESVIPRYEDLAFKVDVLDRCLTDIEKRLKLKRRPTAKGALPPGESS